MSFTSQVFTPERIELAGTQEWILRGGREHFPKLPDAFAGIRTIGVIGWGSQGPAQAKNLRDSLAGTGITVKVGLRPESASWAEANEACPVGAMFDVIAEADLVILLIADAAQAERYSEILAAMKPGATLGLSHGFLLGHLRSLGKDFRDDINVIAVCPKGMGPSVRRLYEQGTGINASFAVHQDVTGHATDYALGWAVGLGAPWIFPTTLEMEYRSDIFGERGILLGAVHAIAESLYRRFCADSTPEDAFRRTAEAITGPISKAISRHGILGLYDAVEDKGAFEAAFAAAYQPMFEIMLECYEEVQSGNELRSVVMTEKRMKRFPMHCIDDTAMWQIGKRVRDNRDKAPAILDPTTAGTYAAAMLAQIDVLLEKGHSYSEVVNESVIEAVDSLNPYMHFRGVAYMVDNCSHTARIGARKWAPRFDYHLAQVAFPALDSGTADPSVVERFRTHPVHDAIARLAELRPPVDIAVLG